MAQVSKHHRPNAMQVENKTSEETMQCKAAYDMGL